MAPDREALHEQMLRNTVDGLVSRILDMRREVVRKQGRLTDREAKHIALAVQQCRAVVSILMSWLIPAVNELKGPPQVTEPQHRLERLLDWFTLGQEHLPPEFRYASATGSCLDEELAVYIAPSKLGGENVDSLRALLHGFPRPLLRPAWTRRKGDAMEIGAALLHGFEFVEFYCGKGMKKGAAIKKVAKAFGIHVATFIQDYYDPKRTPHVRDREAVMKRAYEAGVLFTELEGLESKACTPNQPEAALDEFRTPPGELEELYSEELEELSWKLDELSRPDALAVAGARYKAASQTMKDPHRRCRRFIKSPGAGDVRSERIRSAAGRSPSARGVACGTTRTKRRSCARR
jgi:hypothetical protein